MSSSRARCAVCIRWTTRIIRPAVLPPSCYIPDTFFLLLQQLAAVCASLCWLSYLICLPDAQAAGLFSSQKIIRKGRVVLCPYIRRLGSAPSLCHKALYAAVDLRLLSYDTRSTSYFVHIYMYVVQSKSYVYDTIYDISYLPRGRCTRATHTLPCFLCCEVARRATPIIRILLRLFVCSRPLFSPTRLYAPPPGGVVVLRMPAVCARVLIVVETSSAIDRSTIVVSLVSLRFTVFQSTGLLLMNPHLLVFFILYSVEVQSAGSAPQVPQQQPGCLL